MGDAEDRRKRREQARREALARTLAELERALASEIGEEKTAQAREYIEHHEFGLALELLTALIAAEGVGPAPYGAGVAAAAGRMGMTGPGDLSEWRAYLAAERRDS